MSGMATKVRGRMSPDALRRAPELFDQSLQTIISELLQNARRAGATSVRVTTREERGRTLATFGDDGCGIEDLQSVVSFGRSSWGDDVKRAEDTAGMGTFCLASRGAGSPAGGGPSS